MKKLILAIAVSLGLFGCVAEEKVVYADPSSQYQSRTVEFCDSYGCRWVNAPYYYDSSGVLFYWDVHFGCWVGPHGYWRGGVFYHGFHPGYRGWYHRGWYHGFHGHGRR